MLFVVLLTRLNTMGQVRPGFLILSVLLQVLTPVLLRARLDADLALVQVTVRHSRVFVVFCEVFFYPAALTGL